MTKAEMVMVFFLPVAGCITNEVACHGKRHDPIPYEPPPSFAPKKTEPTPDYSKLPPPK